MAVAIASTPDCWDPGQYERFRDERSQPFYDLAALVRRAPAMRVADLGCGTGELTHWLHRQLKARRTTGYDSSPAMLARATTLGSECLGFEQADIGTWSPPAGSLDLVFSNAAVHWVPGHRDLLPRLREALAPGGQLAIQVPANFDHPSHVVASEVAREPTFRDALGGYTRESYVLAPEAYSALLHRCEFREQHVRLQVYGHLLESSAGVVEWVKGTLLTDYRKRMPPELYDRFLARFRELLLPKLSGERPYFYPFKRILMWGRLAT
ncbi:MAG: methyltransferase domain-containing protein [Candidatus Wallbacteria bacterium]|nr:methyltransferase domain-containing protein [Candidatus Wallbacteria bacterium]